MEGGEVSASTQSQGAAQPTIYESGGQFDEQFANQGQIGNEINTSDENEYVEEIVESPGDSHDKLKALAESGEEIKNDHEQAMGINSKDQTPESEDDKSKESQLETHTPELVAMMQKIMLLQAEAMKIIANSKEGQIDKKELKELMKKLQKVLKELGDENSGENKELLIGSMFGVMKLVLSVAEKGYDEIQEGAKSN